MNYGRVWQLQSSTALLLCCIFSTLLCCISSALRRMRAPQPFILLALETREQIWKQILEKYVLVRRIRGDFGGGKGRMGDTELGFRIERVTFWPQTRPIMASNLLKIVKLECV